MKPLILTDDCTLSTHSNSPFSTESDDSTGSPVQFSHSEASNDESDDFVSEDAWISDSDQHLVKSHKKKRLPKPNKAPRVNFLPRIPKRDIRRSYGLMFANVYNSANTELLQKFSNQLVNNNCTFTLRDESSPLEFKKRLVGNEVMAFFYQRMFDAPDVLCRFEASKIKVRSDGTATLMGFFRITGTRIFPTSVEQEAFFASFHGGTLARLTHSNGPDQKNPNASSPKLVSNESCSSSEASTSYQCCSGVVYSPTNNEDTSNTAGFVPKSFTFCEEGCLSFIIDAHQRISGFDVIMQNKAFDLQLLTCF